MSRKTYRRALNDLLLPLGFKPGLPREWVRVEEGLQDIVLLEVVQDLGTTVSFHFKDLNTVALLAEAGRVYQGYPSIAHTRVASLMGEKRDRYWAKERDPNGPAELAAAVRDFGLPFLEGLHSLQAQAEWCGPLHTNRWRAAREQKWLAMTLYRMGKYADAWRVIHDETRVVPSWREYFENVQRWIDEKTEDGTRRA